MIVFSKTHHQQAGLSLIGLLIAASLIGFLVVIGFRASPTVSEFFDIKRAAAHAVNSSDDPIQIRQAFDKYAQAGYVDTLSGKDLFITKATNGRMTAKFAYEKRIPVLGPVSLVIEYQGSATGGQSFTE